MSTAVATLKALLGLDTAQFESGLNNAGNKAGSFATKFEKSVGGMRKGIEETQGAIAGLGRAMDGSLEGAAMSVKSLIGLFATNPILAAVAAITAALTVGVKMWEKYETAVSDALAKSNAAWKSGQEAWARSVGLRPTDQQSAEKAIAGKSADEMDEVAADSKRKLDWAKYRADEIAKIRDDMVGKKAAKKDIESISEDVKESSATLERLAKYQETLEAAIVKRKAELRKAAQDEWAKTEKQTIDNLREAYEYAEKKKTEAARRESQRRKNDESELNDRLTLAANINDRAADIMTRQRSTRFDNQADSYERMGGQIGGQSRPELRAMDKQAQIQKELLSLAKESLKTAQNIDRKVGLATGEGG